MPEVSLNINQYQVTNVWLIKCWCRMFQRKPRKLVSHMTGICFYIALSNVEHIVLWEAFLTTSQFKYISLKEIREVAKHYFYLYVYNGRLCVLHAINVCVNWYVQYLSRITWFTLANVIMCDATRTRTCTRRVSKPLYYLSRTRNGLRFAFRHN